MRAAAYLTEVNVELTLSASAMGLMPLGPSLLSPMLQVGSGQRVSRCQRLLTHFLRAGHARARARRLMDSSFVLAATK